MLLLLVETISDVQSLLQLRGQKNNDEAAEL